MNATIIILDGDPDWSEINAALDTTPNGRIFEVESGGSWSALVIAPKGTDPRACQNFHDKEMEEN